MTLNRRFIPAELAGVHYNSIGQALTQSISGQFLAKATRYSSRARARDAAAWLRGELTIKPTLKLAAKTFGVSVPRVAEARDNWPGPRPQGKRHPNGANGANGAVLSDDVVTRIVEAVGVERIWRAVDKVTSPELPLQAAQ